MADVLWSPVQYVIDNWEVDSYPEFSDLRYLVVLACIFPFLRYVLDSFVFEKIGRYYIFRNARMLSAAGKAQSAAVLEVRAKEKAAAEERARLLEQSDSKENTPPREPLAPISSEDNGTAPIAATASGKAGKPSRDSAPAANGDSKGPDAAGAQGAQDVASIEAIDKDALEKVHIKFKESCWKALYYTSAFSFALWVSAGEPWTTDVKHFFVGPGTLVWPDQTMKLKLKSLFMYVGGFYTYSVFALVFWETRRKDFVVTMVHHIAAVSLALGAFMFRFGRICSLVVAIHDASDIFLELAKINRYLNIEIMASIMFVCFAASWMVLRLWCYPRYVLYAASYVVTRVIKAEDHPVDGPILYYLFNFTLILLFVLHIYWWILIMRVLIKQIGSRGTVEKDVRSDTEDEDDD